MAEPVLVVRVAANLSAFRAAMQEGTSEILTTKREYQSLSNAFDGSKIISQAGAVVASIQSIGGATKLTAAEQGRANYILEAALAKYAALGREAPPGMLALAESTRKATTAQSDLLQTIGLSGGRMQGLTDATKTADGQTQSITSSYRQFDGVLASMGIRIGPQIKALEDIAGASGKSATQIGLLGTAGLALGAGYAGWKLGRMIAEFFDLDKAAESAWRQLLYFGDVAAETAGAKMDVINRAIANGAKETISYSEAVRFNIDLVQKNADANINWAQKLSAAQREVRGLSDAQIAGIELAQKAGATTEQLTHKYGISADGLKALAERQKGAGQAAEGHTKALDAQRAAVEKLDADYAKLMSSVKNANQLAIMEADAAALARKAENANQLRMMERDAHQMGMKELDERVAAEASAETARIAQNQAEIDGIMNAGAAHTEAGGAAVTATNAAVAGYAAVAQQVTLTGDAVKEWINLQRYSAEVNAIFSTNSLFTSTSQRERVAALPRASGGPVSAGQPYMVGERGRELFVPERSGTIVPNGGGSSITIAPVLHFHGPVLGSSLEFDAAVSGALLNVLRSGAVSIPAGVG